VTCHARSRQDRFRAAVQLRAGVHAERRSQRLPRSVDAANAGPSAAPVPISTALQEQLGIQLRSTEAPVETIVIEASSDHLRISFETRTSDPQIPRIAGPRSWSSQQPAQSASYRGLLP
jgi:hypothetical protein